MRSQGQEILSPGATSLAATVHVCLTQLQEFFWWQGEGISQCESVRVIPADSSMSILAFVSCIQGISDLQQC